MKRKTLFFIIVFISLVVFFRYLALHHNQIKTDKLDENIKQATKIDVQIKKQKIANYDNKIKYKKLSSFEKKVIKENIDDLYKIMPNLNPVLFENEKLKVEARKVILKNLDFYFGFLKSKNILDKKTKIKDVLLRGSMGGFIYHKKSDLDIDVCIKNQTSLDNKSFYKLSSDLYYATYSALLNYFNSNFSYYYKLPITFSFNSCDFHLDQESKVAKTTGTYSVIRDKWIIKPQKTGFNFSLKNLYDFILGNIYKSRKIYDYFEINKTNKKEFCEIFKDNYQLYIKNRHSSFVYLENEGYSIQNLGTKTLDNMNLRKNYYQLHYECFANLEDVENLKIKRKKITQKKRAYNDYGSKKGVCKEIKDYKNIANKKYKEIIEDYFDNKKPAFSKKQVKEKLKIKIKNKLHKVISDKNNNYKSKTYDILVFSDKFTNNYSKNSNINVYLIKKFIKSVELSEKQNQDMFVFFQKYLKAKELEFNARDIKINENTPVELVIKTLYEDEFDYSSLGKDFYSFEKEKWFYQKQKNSNNKQDFLTDNWSKYFSKIYKIYSQDKIENACACIEKQKLSSLKEGLAVKLIESSKYYKNYQYKTKACRLRSLSFGDYKKYIKLFD